MFLLPGNHWLRRKVLIPLNSGLVFVSNEVHSIECILVLIPLNSGLVFVSAGLTRKALIDVLIPLNSGLVFVFSDR